MIGTQLVVVLRQATHCTARVSPSATREHQILSWLPHTAKPGFREGCPLGIAKVQRPPVPCPVGIDRDVSQPVPKPAALVTVPLDVPLFAENRSECFEAPLELVLPGFCSLLVHWFIPSRTSCF